MSKKINLIIGSTRQGRVSTRIADWLVKTARDEGFELGVYDLREINLPMFDAPVSPMYAPVQTAEAKAWQEKIADSDAVIFLTAEYNRSIPAPLKNAIDYLFAEWNDKPAHIVSYGYIDGGGSATKHLLDILAMVKARVATTPDAVKFDDTTFDDQGNFKNIDATLASIKPNFTESLKSL